MSSYASNASDLGYSGWADATRNYLNATANSDVNTIMWSWCGQVNSVDIQTHYLDKMQALENRISRCNFRLYDWAFGRRKNRRCLV